MTREAAKTFLATNLGIEAPTDEQITSFLNTLGSETKSANDRALKYKADADKLSELQAQLDALNDEKLSDIEKANKEREKSDQKVADLEKKILEMQTLKSLADLGITGDDATKLIGENGALDFETLGKIIKDRENAAADAKVKEIANNTTNPDGGSAGKDNGNDGDKPADLVNAESITFGGLSKDFQNTRDFYK